MSLSRLTNVVAENINGLLKNVNAGKVTNSAKSIIPKSIKNGALKLASSLETLAEQNKVAIQARRNRNIIYKYCVFDNGITCKLGNEINASCREILGLPNSTKSARESADFIMKNANKKV